MRRIAPFVLLLLALPAAGTALAEDVPPAEEAPAGAEATAPDDAPAADEADAVAKGDAAPDADAEATTPADDGPKRISGMSILGNQEAPTSLVIVPWKTSHLGDSLGIETMLDDSRQPVDRDVFLRSLSYYEIRSESTP